MGYNKFPDLGCSASQGIIRNTLWGLSCNFLSIQLPVNTGERFEMFLLGILLVFVGIPLAVLITVMD